MKFYQMNGDKNQTIICKPMQISKLLANNFTISKSIYKRHFQKWSAMLKCRWIKKPVTKKEKKSNEKLKKYYIKQS